MTTGQIIGLIVIVLLTIFGGIMISKKSKSHTLLKWTGLFFFAAILMTWVFGAGYYQGGQLAAYGMVQEGLSDIPSLFEQVVDIAGDKLIFLLTLGIFYGVLSKNAGYKKLVSNIAKKMKGKETVFVLSTSFILALMASMFNQTFATLVFVPFLISVILNMKLDKITAFAGTFGGVLVGVLGILYGGEGVYWFNQYNGTVSTTAILYRLFVFVVAFLVFATFMILHMKKVLKSKKANELDSDPFLVEGSDKKAKVTPIVIVLSLVLVLLILGFVPWNAIFGIEAFDKFHEWLFNLSLTSDGELKIFRILLGTDASKVAFGRFNLFSISAVMLFFTCLVGIMSSMKLDEFLSSIVNGIKKMLKPAAFLILGYAVLMAAYASPFVATISDGIFNGATKFNPYTVSLMSMFANIFHVDFGYTGFVLAPFFTTTFTANTEVIHTIFTTLFGFAGFFVPTQVILLVGLNYLNIEYKEWIKFIWKFVLIMLVVLLLLFTFMTYVF